MNKPIKKNGGTSMKKRKILSLFLSLCLLIGLLPTVALAADQEASAAGVQITEESYDSATGILTVNVQIKMPDNSGITTVGTLLSYDSSKLTLLHKTKNATTYAPSDPRTSVKPSVVVKLTNSDDDLYSTDGGVDLYGTGNRAGLFVGLGTTGQPSNEQKTTDWLTIYQLRFKVSGDPKVVLNSDSLRIADPAKDNDVIKGAYVANDYYTVSVNSSGNKWFKYGKMAANSESELTGNHWAIPAANVTATYPGSTNSVTPPAPTTYTVSFNANGGTGSMADVTGVSGEYTLPANGFTAPSGKQFKAWSVGGSEKAAGDKITVTANTTVTAVWEAIEYNVTVTGGTASVGAGTPITKATMGTTVTLTAGAAPSGKVFDKWVVESGSVALADANSATTTFTMPAEAVSVKATYKTTPVTTYNLTTQVNGGHGTISASKTGLTAGSTETITFTPDAGYKIDTVTVNGTATSVSGNTLNVTMNENKTVVVTYKAIEYNITVTGGTASVGAGTPITKATMGTTVTLTAGAAPTGKVFDKWEVVSGGITLADVNSATTTFTMPGNAVKIEATYKDAPPSHTHSYGTDWKYDDTNHWHECQCGDKADVAAHIASEWIVDTAATETADGAKHKECTVCKKVLETATIPATGSSHTHSYGTEWKYDDTNHWHECQCGDKADMAAHSFQWVIDKAATKEATGIKHEECTVCGAKRSENTVIDKLPDGGNTGNTGSGDNNTNKPGKDDSTKSPQTGDSSNLIGWLAALFVSGGVLTVLGVNSKKRKESEAE